MIMTSSILCPVLFQFPNRMPLRHLIRFYLGIHLLVHISDRSTDRISFVLLRDVISIIINIFMIDLSSGITLQVLLEEL
jgi:hypothetical protein